MIWEQLSGAQGTQEAPGCLGARCAQICYRCEPNLGTSSLGSSLSGNECFGPKLADLKMIPENWSLIWTDLGPPGDKNLHAELWATAERAKVL